MRQLPLPPGPKARIPGADWLNVFPHRNPLPFVTMMAREFGDIVHHRAGRQHIILLSHPDLIREVLVGDSQAFAKSRVMQRTKVLLGEGLLTSEGEFHMRQRRLMQPAFHRQRLPGYGAIMVNAAARLREQWPSGVAIDVHQEMMRLTVAIVAEALFSSVVDTEAAEIGAAVTSLLNLFPFMVLPFSEWLEKLPIGPARKAARAVERLDATIYRMIEARRANRARPDDLLTMLLEARDTEGDGGGMTDRQLRDECMTLFVAGHETTAVALTWTWYLLSQHSEVEARLHAEIDSVLGNRLPTTDDFPRLVYTEMVLAESMRIFPPAWTLARTALQPLEIRGYRVPRGSLLMMSQWVMHRDPRYFPDPERFDPERWTRDARGARPKYSYFPFGGGPRQCIGEGFAWMEGVLLLATIAQRWTMRLVPGHPVEPQPRITLRPRFGMKMVLERRKPAPDIVTRPAAGERVHVANAPASSPVS
jgi:cytochrome P450